MWPDDDKTQDEEGTATQFSCPDGNGLIWSPGRRAAIKSTEEFISLLSAVLIKRSNSEVRRDKPPVGVSYRCPGEIFAGIR